MRSKNDSHIELPDLDWRKATCTVCGAAFDYFSRKRPPTCKNGNCLHKYHYGIDRDTWADYQPTFFDKK